jgi:methionine aminopeptidase
MGHGSWFHPSITIHRQGSTPPTSNVIQRGDVLHTDFGLVYLGFSTDTQHNAYVLKQGESDAPQGLKDGLKAGNRLQDLTMQYAKVGRTGNQALALAQKLQSFGKTYELIVYAGDDHGVSLNRADAERRIIEWFKKHLK